MLETAVDLAISSTDSDNPRDLLIAKNAVDVIVNSGYFKDGFVYQTGTGGASLSVTKKVTGVFANLLKSFKITINIRDAQNSPLNGTYTATVNNKRTPLQFTNGRVSIDLNKDQTIKIDGLPLDSHYTVEEESNSSRGYQVSYENQEGKLDGDKFATVTNNKNSVPETGVDFLSSTLVLGIILPLGGIFFTILLGYLVVHRRK